jgi:hypothetical protein
MMREFSDRFRRLAEIGGGLPGAYHSERNHASTVSFSSSAK